MTDKLTIRFYVKEYENGDKDLDVVKVTYKCVSFDDLLSAKLFYEIFRREIVKKDFTVRK